MKPYIVRTARRLGYGSVLAVPLLRCADVSRPGNLRRLFESGLDSHSFR